MSAPVSQTVLGPLIGFVRLPPRETPYVRADVFMEKTLT